MAYFCQWFDGRQAIQSLPEDCINDCSASGSVDNAVDYWIDKINFQAPAWLVREHLSGYGAWDKSELCDHNSNLRRLLWLWACECSEYDDYDHRIYLMR